MSHSPRIYIRGVSETIPDTETGFSLIFDRPANLANPITPKPHAGSKIAKRGCWYGSDNLTVRFSKETALPAILGIDQTRYSLTCAKPWNNYTVGTR